jgi:hypothetical protein
MNYPADMTQDEIMQFEYEYCRWLDMTAGEGQYWEVNALLQIEAQAMRELV